MIHSRWKGVCALVLAAGLAGPSTALGQIEVAEELLVDLDAADPSAGEALWVNAGTMGDFERVGNPVVEDVAGVTAVTFNSTAELDAYRSLEPAPDGVVGLNPTRTIEVWAYNPAISTEETLVAWGWRGGPAGTNMSFNYGNHGAYGAIGHWDFPDIGWDDAGGAPQAGRWHHLVYTFDGDETDEGDPTFTTHVYADGCLTGEFCNEEFLGEGVINTNVGTPIVLTAQLNNANGDLNAPLRGTLSLGRVRVHDGVLTADQVLANYEAEMEDFIKDRAPEFTSVPTEGNYFAGAATYRVTVAALGFPEPTFEAVAPAGATVSDEGVYSYDIPNPQPASFVATVRATNSVGSVEASWTVSRRDPPPGLEVAEDLLVSLDAADPTAGEEIWENQGTMGDFERVGNPVVEEIVGVPAVTFNSPGDLDAYRSLQPAPDGVVGLNPTRTIEVWAYNPAIAPEETMVAWGWRGGPAGTNMSFNYGTHGAFGAIGHWDFPDIGWNDAGGAPEAGKWHHLVYTFDGSETDEGDPTFTTKVYADGCLTLEFCNQEVLGEGVINTNVGTPIVLAAQLNNGNGDLNAPLRGTLSFGRVRVHDGVLSEEQVLANFEAEEADFTPATPPEITSVPDSDVYTPFVSAYTAQIAARGTPEPVLEATSPDGATVVDGVFSYDIPDPAPDSFVATVTATNAGGTVESSWTVTRLPDGLAIAEQLFVDLDAGDGTGGEAIWENHAEDSGGVGNFTIIGEPFVQTFEAELAGVPDLVEIEAVTFNDTGLTQDAYQSEGNAAEGLVGLDATRSVEVWAMNPEITDEETMVSWGRREGPDGSEVSFNYGTHSNFGAVTHWGGDGPDMGWIDNTLTQAGAPDPGVWHHLVYTYDGTTTRAYADGELWNSEVLGAGVINTHAEFPITIAAQIQNAAGDLNVGLEGLLSIARIRVHDGVLPAQAVIHNYHTDIADFAGIVQGASLKTGDVNGDGAYNISDAVAQLAFLFASGAIPECFLAGGELSAAGLAILDFNGDGGANISDAVASLNFLFGGGLPPALGEGCTVQAGDCVSNC